MTLHYETVGTGIPVVFIHAGIADSRMWQPQFDAVPDGFKYIRLDLQGFGKSPFAGDEFSFHGDVLGLMDLLTVDSAVLVGCSIGASVVMGVAETAPDRVKAMVLVGGYPPGFEPPGGPFESPQWNELVEAFKAGNMERAAELDAETWVVGHGRPRDQVDQEIFDLVVEMDLIAMANEEARDEKRVPPVLETLPKINGPTLVVVGEFDLPDERAAADYLATHLSDREAVVIRDAAHLASLEQPAIFNVFLEDFIRGVT